MYQALSQAHASCRAKFYAFGRSPQCRPSSVHSMHNVKCSPCRPAGTTRTNGGTAHSLCPGVPAPLVRQTADQARCGKQKERKKRLGPRTLPIGRRRRWTSLRQTTSHDFSLAVCAVEASSAEPMQVTAAWESFYRKRCDRPEGKKGACVSLSLERSFSVEFERPGSSMLCFRPKHQDSIVPVKRQETGRDRPIAAPLMPDNTK